MKTYNAINRKSAHLKRAIENTIQYHDEFKNSYFWTPPRSAGARRSGEREFEKNNPSYMINTVIGGKNVEIEVNPELSYSCNNVYYSLSIYIRKVGDESWVTKDIRLLKKIIK